MRDEIEEAIRRIESEDAWDDAATVVEIKVKQPLDKIVPVRLTSEKWAALHREARELGVGPSTLARMWILEHLRTLEPSAAAGTGVALARRKAGPTA